MTAVASSSNLTGPRRLVQLWAAMVRVELSATVAYRAQALLWILAWLVPLAFLALWRSAAADGPVGGITAEQFSTYFCLVLVTTNLQIVMPVVFDGGWLVYSGQMSARLLQPCHPVMQVVARAVAGKLVSLPGLLIVVPVAFVLTGASVSASGMDWVVAVLMTLLGTLSMTYLAATVSTLSFWMARAQGVQGLLVGGEWVLGGIVAPVALLPGPWPGILRHQPLYFADAAAPEILSGISPSSGWLVVEAAAWVVALHFLFRIVWRRALRRYDAVGT